MDLPSFQFIAEHFVRLASERGLEPLLDPGRPRSDHMRYSFREQRKGERRIAINIMRNKVNDKTIIIIKDAGTGPAYSIGPNQQLAPTDDKVFSWTTLSNDDPFEEVAKRMLDAIECCGRLYASTMLGRGTPCQACPNQLRCLSG